MNNLNNNASQERIAAKSGAFLTRRRVHFRKVAGEIDRIFHGHPTELKSFSFTNSYLPHVTVGTDYLTLAYYRHFELVRDPIVNHHGVRAGIEMKPADILPVNEGPHI